MKNFTKFKNANTMLFEIIFKTKLFLFPKTRLIFI